MTDHPHAVSPLPRAFYARHSLEVARDLLGMVLVRQEPGLPRLSGIIVETEAYTGLDDLASHGRHKPTPRNQPMWGPPGHAYVYMSRGIHWMLNITTEPEGAPAAILIRAIRPIEGVALMQARRPKISKPRELTSGPARMTIALNITGALNKVDVTTPDAGVWVEPGQPLPDDQVRTGPRIGLGKTPEPWLSIAWRWYVADEEYVSR
jgi:DNA-3-methyladenine glycosylase